MRLREEFYDYIKINNNLNAVHINPTKKELEEISENGKRMLRFIATKDKIVYVFDAHTLVHQNIEEKLKIKNTLDIFKGIIKKQNGKWTIYSSNVGEFAEDYKWAGKPKKFKTTADKIKKLMSKDFSWLNKYFEADKEIDKVKSALNEEFFDFLKRKEKLSAIYKNPTKKELDAAAKEYSPHTLRFLVKDKNVYIFNSEHFIHRALEIKLGIENKPYDFLKGELEKRNGKWQFCFSDNLSFIFEDALVTFKNKTADETDVEIFERLSKMLDKDYTWVEKYFEVSSSLEYYRKFRDRVKKVGDFK